MADKTIEIEADSLEEAKEQVKSHIPEGFYLLSEETISDGSKTITSTADTIEAAFAKAQSQAPGVHSTPGWGGLPDRSPVARFRRW